MARKMFRHQFIFKMALMDQEVKERKENSKEPLVTNFNKPFVCMFPTSFLDRSVIPKFIKFSNFIEQNV
jgi:hypothetical protein